MIGEKSYERLQPGDQVWWAGALLRVTKAPTRRGIIVDFEGQVVRRDAREYYELEQIVPCSGLAHTPARIEVDLVEIEEPIADAAAAGGSDASS